MQVGGGCERQSGKAVNAQRGLEGGEGQSWEGALRPLLPALSCPVDALWDPQLVAICPPPLPVSPSLLKADSPGPISRFVWWPHRANIFLPIHRGQGWLRFHPTPSWVIHCPVRWAAVTEAEDT